MATYPLLIRFDTKLIHGGVYLGGRSTDFVGIAWLLF